MKIRKTSQTVGLVGSVSTNIASQSENAVPTCNTVKTYVDNKHNYVSQETVIGKWINNKTTYRKVIHINSVGTAGTGVVNVDTGVKMDFLVNMYGSFKKDSDNSLVPVNASRTQGVSVIGTTISYNTATQTHTICFDVGSDRSALWGDIVIEYTKAN